MINEWENACRNNGVISGIRTTGGVEVPDDAWTCVHCRSVCPPNAQCKIYSRTNKKRNLTLRRKKMERKSTIDVLPGVRMMGESEQDFLLEGMEEVLGFEIPLK